MIWQDLKTPAVRDLAWACFSEPMLLSSRLARPDCPLDNCQLQLDHERADALRQLDRHPAPLLEHLAQRHTHRLGIYFEQLWHFFLQHDAHTELIAHNLAVRDGGRTLGEFDCIYLCKRQRRFYHLELAVKFYLGVPGQAVWLGPGCEDQLSLKVDHLLQQQIRLADRAQARQLLAERGIDELHRQIEIKGYLFANPDISMADVATPDVSTPDVSTPDVSTPLPAGHNSLNNLQQWHTLAQFVALAPPPEDWLGWRHIPRERWLAPVSESVTDPPSSPLAELSRLASHFEHSRQPLLYACCDEDGEERYRCFITANDWPHRVGNRSATADPARH